MEHTIIATSKKGVFIGWWIFWLVVFWPMLILTLVCHLSSLTLYHVQYQNDRGQIVVEKMTEKQYNHFVNH